jgi:Phage integrase family
MASATSWLKITRAGLPDHCVTHRLRKAAARRLAEAGCTANEIAAITGHATLQGVSRYTKAGGTEQARRGRHTATFDPRPVHRFPTRFQRFGNPSEKPQSFKAPRTRVVEPRGIDYDTQCHIRRCFGSYFIARAVAIVGLIVGYFSCPEAWAAVVLGNCVETRASPSASVRNPRRSRVGDTDRSARPGAAVSIAVQFGPTLSAAAVNSWTPSVLLASEQHAYPL